MIRTYSIISKIGLLTRSSLPGTRTKSRSMIGAQNYHTSTPVVDFACEFLQNILYMPLPKFFLQQGLPNKTFEMQ
jgi:hypothetical protein